MNIHEYQAKGLFKKYGLPVPNNIVVSSVEEVLPAITSLEKNTWVVKAQVHAGGRGKAGGVAIIKGDKDAVVQKVRSMLGTRLVTYQTDATGQPVNQVLIEEPCDIDKELYLSAVIDRSLQRIVIMASTEGGVDIEKVAEETPDKIFKLVVNPLVGVMPNQARELGFLMNLNASQIKQLTKILLGLGKMFVENDLSLVEVNPLVITKDGDLLCLDGKVALDENALYRHPSLQELRDPSQEDERENIAKNWNLNYISLDGDIGCMVNGAGLAMATMDMIKLHGGEPANFLDVGGGATRERVAEAFKIILSDPNVKAILVNIFGGIVRCDIIAEGIIEAVKEVKITIPVVVRLEGNNKEAGIKLLNDSDVEIAAAESLTNAADLVVKLAKGEK